MNAALRDALKKLRLSGLSESLEVRLQEATSSQLTHAEFLELVLEDELAVRRDRLVSRRIKAAAFRDQKAAGGGVRRIWVNVFSTTSRRALR